MSNFKVWENRVFFLKMHWPTILVELFRFISSPFPSSVPDASKRRARLKLKTLKSVLAWTTLEMKRILATKRRSPRKIATRIGTLSSMAGLLLPLPLFSWHWLPFLQSESNPSHFAANQNPMPQCKCMNPFLLQLLPIISTAERCS